MRSPSPRRPRGQAAGSAARCCWPSSRSRGHLVNLFHPPEFVAIIILALVLIGGTGESTSSGKVILSGAIGLMFSFIGSDPVTGVDRFTFGNLSLMDGLNVVPFALGVFALTQMVTMFSGTSPSPARRTPCCATRSAAR